MASGSAISSFHAGTNREDLLDVITNISPSETPFFSSLGKTKATNAYHEWSTDSLASATANAQVEGQDYSFTVKTTPTRTGAYVQTFRNFAEVSDFEREMNPAGMDDMFAYQMAKAMKEQARDIELALFTGTGASGASGTARELKGALAFVSTNTGTGYYSGTGSSTPETLFNTNLQAIWTAGGKPDTTYVNAAAKKAISAFTASATKFFNQDAKEVINGVDVYDSDFGRVKIVADHFITAGKILTIQSDLCKVAVAIPTKKVEAAKIASTTRGVIETALCLELRQEAGCGVLTLS
jgi:hypothetical protein